MNARVSYLFIWGSQGVFQRSLYRWQMKVSTEEIKGISRLFKVALKSR